MSACLATLLLWLTAISFAHAQSCTMYVASAGDQAGTPWEPTAQQAANVLVKMCNSGLSGNGACFGGYSAPPAYYGCNEQIQGETCLAEMPTSIPTPAYGHPVSISFPVLVTTPTTGSSTQHTVMGLGANVFDNCNNYFVQTALIRQAVADEGGSCTHCKNDTDPVNPSSGNEALVENDIEPMGWRGRLAFSRYYNSVDTSATDMGPGWRHSFSRYLKVDTITLNSCDAPPVLHDRGLENHLAPAAHILPQVTPMCERLLDSQTPDQIRGRAAMSQYTRES